MCSVNEIFSSNVVWISSNPVFYKYSDFEILFVHTVFAYYIVGKYVILDAAHD